MRRNAADNKFTGEGVKHDGVRVEFRRIQLINRVLMNDIEINIFFAPIIRRAAEVFVNFV